MGNSVRTNSSEILSTYSDANLLHAGTYFCVAKAIFGFKKEKYVYKPHHLFYLFWKSLKFAFSFLCYCLQRKGDCF
jgi:hypothetical protein